MKYSHIELLRLTIGRKMDTNRMFAVWRIDSPWQPITKKGQGQRMGGGKGSIDHYVTPVKPGKFQTISLFQIAIVLHFCSGRIIVEVGGKCEYQEVKGFLEDLAKKMPFKAIAVSQEIMDEMKAKEEYEEKNNLNPFTLKYIIQNNMGGCHSWIKPIDFKWFGKYQ